ncbi:18286_t:CDS:1, partial [Funneliformis geosporum]
MNYQQKIINYPIPSDFASSNHINDPLFLSYINRNEINQNLSNAPLNNQTNHKLSNYDSTFLPWFPSENFKLLLIEFNNKILYDYPSIPCAYCSILMMKSSVKWIDYNSNEIYTLTISFPDISLPITQNNRGKTKIAVCSSCKTMKNHRFPPILSQ